VIWAVPRAQITASAVSISVGSADGAEGGNQRGDTS
jgi:hypothetical protein